MKKIIYYITLTFNMRLLTISCLYANLFLSLLVANWANFNASSVTNLARADLSLDACRVVVMIRFSSLNLQFSSCAYNLCNSSRLSVSPESPPTLSKNFNL